MPRPADALCVVLLLAGSDALAAAEKTSASVVLRWKLVPEAATYQIDIARDAYFRSLVLSAHVSVAGYRWREIPVTRYYWRVRSIDSLGRSGGWSPFKTIEPALVAPTLVAPEDRASFALESSSPYTLELACSPSKLAKSYSLEVATDPDFKSIVTRASGASPAFSVTLSTGQFYWRMRSTSLSGRETSPSKARDFSIGPRPLGHASPGQPVKETPKPRVKTPVACSGEFHPAPPTPVAPPPVKPPDAPAPGTGSDSLASSAFVTETTLAPRPEQDNSLSVGVQAGWYTNFARVSTLWVGLQGTWSTGLLSSHLLLSGRIGTYATQTTVPAMPGLSTSLSAAAHLFPASLLAIYEARFSGRALYAGGGPCLTLARVVSGQDVGTSADLGMQAVLGARLPLGPGSVFAESGLFLGSIDSPLAHLKTSGLLLSMGYQFGR